MLSRPRSLAAAAATLALGLSAATPAAAAIDPLLPEQWSLVDARAIGAPEALTQSRGEGVVVAVLDSGVQTNHPDLYDNLWKNSGEVAANGVDDDRNGFVDDVHGANIIAVNGNVEDDEGHGTHVAGIIAARAGNGTGVAGLAPNARIMVVKVLDSNRSGNTSLLARGIRYAVDEGARILNVSINGDDTSGELDDALRYAGERGATVVASAGNNSRDIDLKPSYPASSRESSVLSVTASDQSFGLLSFANRGLGSIDLAAPGSQILSTARGSDYETRSGTSMAAPHVSGSLALLSAARPDLSQPDLRAALLASASKPPSLLGLLGSGALNAAAAMHRVLPGGLWRAAPATPAATPAAAGAALRLRTGAAVRAGRTARLRWSLSGTDAVDSWRVYLDGRRVKLLKIDDAPVVRKRIARAGRHRWNVVGHDAAGAPIVAAARSFSVLRRGR